MLASCLHWQNKFIATYCYRSTPLREKMHVPRKFFPAQFTKVLLNQLPDIVYPISTWNQTPWLQHSANLAMLTLSVNNSHILNTAKNAIPLSFQLSQYSQVYSTLITSFHKLGTADSIPKQSFLSQNTPKRCILHSNTHCLVKNRATSQFAHKLATFSSSRPSCFFPSHCALLKIFLLQSKMSKEGLNLLLYWQLGKTTIRPFADTLFFLAL